MSNRSHRGLSLPRDFKHFTSQRRHACSIDTAHGYLKLRKRFYINDVGRARKVRRFHQSPVRQVQRSSTRAITKDDKVSQLIGHVACSFAKPSKRTGQEKLSDALSILGEAEEADSTAQQAAQKACRLHAEDLAELRIGSEEIHIQGRVIRSLHMIREGLRLEQSALWDDENLLMDLVWDSVDAYHEAIFVSDGADLAQEAEAIARLGIIYSKILKQPVRGKNYCVKALNLASSLHPRVFTFVPWHQTASDIVKAYQEELVARERSAWEAKRKPYLEKLAPELKKLEEASTEGLDSLIDMIYDKHPPLNKKHTKPTAEGKKRIQHAIRHYHPDKGNVSEETKVLLEEITKLLTAHLNAAKGL
ncbi:uncharacterized protein MONBRDRAFT_11218 [Monosiga brevicollis MX1]|uniref:J domain-containing protein n=1 Tax=Monosiga brevicollis TaxID=81824 RepID=A9V8K1_MONBE|nr:uncharacterized protein MONBRDRAFT_11218 [Monosiga brevicollis MX1]EDQ86158.1 predicted protein [Monosiga brevicollis MX1]|eukprot:XP_001749083.1 hypothetical protein [Monosiga brevicollis MX1]